MQEVDRDEYARMKDFFTFYTERYLDITALPPDKRPLASLEDLEKRSLKKALSGLRQAINDCLEMSFHLSHEEVEKLDVELRNKGIVTLSELRRRYSAIYAKIVKRGRIKNDTEYYLVRNVLHDPNEKPLEERDLLEKLLSEYEPKPAASARNPSR